MQNEQQKPQQNGFNFPFIIKAIELIKTTPDAYGKIVCPKCNNKLDYTKKTNVHIWGRCETENCLNWQQ